MAINAQDVTRAFSSPLDYGSLITQSLEQQRKRELEDAQLAQQQEDRDIKRAQLFNETLSPLNKDTGTYYDNLLHNQMSDFYTKEYPEYMKQNPKAKLGQQIMFANQYVGGLAHKAEQAKQIQAYSKAYAKNVAQDVKGVDETALANSLEKSAYESGDMANDWSDVLRNKAGDMDFVTNHYKLNEDALKRLNETVNATASNVQGGNVTIGKKIYETKQGAPMGFEFDYTAGKAIPKVEQVDIPTVRMNGLTPVQTVQKVGLVPMKTVETYIAHPEFHHALNKEAYDLKATDELAKDMDAATLTRYAATKLLGKVSAKGSVEDVTDKIIRQNSQDAERKLNMDAKRAELKAIPNALKLKNAVETGDLSQYQPMTLGLSGGGTVNASLITQDLKEGVIPLDKDKGVQLYLDNNGKYYIRYMNAEKGMFGGNTGYVADPDKEPTQISNALAKSYISRAVSELGSTKSFAAPNVKPEKNVTTTNKPVTSQAKPIEYNVGIPTIQLDAMDAAINQAMSGKKVKSTKKTK